MPNMSLKLPTDIPIFKNLDEFDKNLPETVELLRTNNGDRVYVIGTAHYSTASQDDVSLVVRNVQPDAIVLELCALRKGILFNDETKVHIPSKLTLKNKRDIIRELGVSGAIFYMAFINISTNLTSQLQMPPGGECRRALAECSRLDNCRILLGDRPINITMRRAIDEMSVLDRLKFATMLRAGEKASTEKITVEDVERFKKRDLQPMNDMERALPAVHSAFVTERDIILAHALFLAAGTMSMLKNKGHPARVVGVVGMAHLPGIIRNFGQTSASQVSALMSVSKQRWQDVVERAWQKFRSHTKAEKK